MEQVHRTLIFQVLASLTSSGRVCIPPHPRPAVLQQHPPDAAVAKSCCVQLQALDSERHQQQTRQTALFVNGTGWSAPALPVTLVRRSGGSRPGSAPHASSNSASRPSALQDTAMQTSGEQLDELNWWVYQFRHALIVDFLCHNRLPGQSL